jgi:hypothetical protein
VTLKAFVRISSDKRASRGWFRAPTEFNKKSVLDVKVRTRRVHLPSEKFSDNRADCLRERILIALD